MYSEIKANENQTSGSKTEVTAFSEIYSRLQSQLDAMEKNISGIGEKLNKIKPLDSPTTTERAGEKMPPSRTEAFTFSMHDALDRFNRLNEELNRFYQHVSRLV